MSAASRACFLAERLGAGPIGQFRIEMMEAIDVGGPPRKSALAGGRRSVDGDDRHGSPVGCCGGI